MSPITDEEVRNYRLSSIVHSYRVSEQEAQMDADDRTVAETARKNGVGVLHNLLLQDELDAICRELDQAYLDLNMGPGEPGSRDSLRNEPLLNYPALDRLFSHPRVLGIASAILSEPRPFLLEMKTNRYTPEHKGVGRHTDGSQTEPAAPFQWLATMIYLDDIDINSGALTYVPGTHLHYFASPGDPNPPLPTLEDIQAGDYVPVELKAGSVVFRVPEVWHGVVPIHRLRRYITGLYTSRGKVNALVKARIQQVRKIRKAIPETSVPEHVRKYWRY